MKKPNHILITGGEGFIGRSIGNFLIKKNKNIISIDNLSNSEIKNHNKKIIFYKADLRNVSKIEKIFTDVFGDLQGIGPEALQGLSEFADATGRTLKTVTQQLRLSDEGAQFKGVEKLPGTLAYANALFVDVRELTGETLKNANALNQTQLEILQGQEVAVNLQEALNSGAANAEQIEKRRSAVLAKIANLKKSTSKVDETTAKVLEDTFRLQDQSAQAQLAVLKERDKLLKTFSAEIKAAEKLNEIFTLIADGENTRVELGITSNDKARNRVKILQEDFELGKAALAQERAGEKLEGLRAQKASLARDAQKALVGVFVKTNEEARKLADTLEKISKTLTAQAQKAILNLGVEEARRARQLSEQQATSQKAEIDRVEKLRQATQKLADVRSKAGEATRKLDQKLVGDLAGQTFQTDQDKRALILKFAEEDLKALRTITATQVINIQDKADAEEKKLKADILNLQKQLGEGGRESLIQKEFEQRKKLEQAAANARKQTKIDEIDLLEQRKKGIAEEAMAFNDHIGGIRDVLAADVVARKEVLEGDDFVKNTVDALRAAGKGSEAARLNRTGDVGVARAARVDLGKGEAEAVAQKGLTDLIERLTATDFSKLKEQVNAAFKAEEELATFRRDIANNNEILAAEEKLATARSNLAALGINTKAEIEALNLALKNAGISFNNLSVVTKGANDNFKTALKGTGDIIEGGLTQGFMDFNNALMSGNLTFRSISRGFKDMVGDMLRAIQRQVFMDTIAKPASNAIMKLIGFSQGGPAHMAGGGSMKRDRIPAMLEPGEFVIRKEAAKMIGLSKLQEMNSGNANIFKMLGMKPVKKAGGGPAGSAGMSGSGDHSGTSAAGIGGGGGGGGSDIGVGFARDFLTKHPDANIFADSTMTAMALSSMGRRFGMSGAIDPRNALDIERKIDYAKGSANVIGEDFNLEQAYKKANTGFFGRTINAIAPKTPMDMVSLLLAGAGGSLGKGISRVRSGIQIGTKATLFGEEIESLGLQGALEQEERFRMQQAAGGSIRHMAGGGSVNTRDRVPALLEPGEFVIRRPMAKAIGGQALSQMNSTGRPPQISVNLNNSGAPKSVNVQPPKVNGDKIILDIITRDIRNNGSMRKALRRGK